jgi:hypothetical protein
MTAHEKWRRIHGEARPAKPQGTAVPYQTGRLTRKDAF